VSLNRDCTLIVTQFRLHLIHVIIQVESIFCNYIVIFLPDICSQPSVKSPDFYQVFNSFVGFLIFYLVN
jgi:hypothetical protein